MHGMMAMSKRMRAIGLMSGTSMDGIDIAAIETDGEDMVQRGPSGAYPYSDEMRAQLRAGLADATTIKQRDERPGRLGMLEQYLTDLHAEAVTQFLEDHLIEPTDIDVIGFHGQTVLHRPAAIEFGAVRNGRFGHVGSTLTVQLGDGARLASATGIDVVYDLRAADAAAGGQAAPLVPAYHRALVSSLDQKPVAVVNIGGVANITFIGRNGELIAFDTGPGNAMIDDWMLRHTGHSHDPDGRQAAQGRVHDDYVAEYLKHSFFSTPAPKSLDRNAFPVELVDELSVADGAATLTALTATAIAHARALMPEDPQLWIVGGGGRRNRTLMSMLAARVQNAVVPAEAVGLDGDSLEAEAWAYMAVRSLKGLPITFPGTTGVAGPMTGGVLARK
jgi:anhydro-N-acetylmuramic acid kinase